MPRGEIAFKLSHCPALPACLPALSLLPLTTERAKLVLQSFFREPLLSFASVEWPSSLRDKASPLRGCLDVEESMFMVASCLLMKVCTVK